MYPIHHRKFGSQIWTDEKQKWEEKRREEKRRLEKRRRKRLKEEKVRRKKIQVCEKVGGLRNSVFSHDLWMRRVEN